jgi:hypothetical protein
MWFHHAGSPIRVYCLHPDGTSATSTIGSHLTDGESPQYLFPAGVVFGAEVVQKDTFSLVSCMVSPGFDYRDFEMPGTDELVNRYPGQSDLITRINGRR